MAKYVKGKRIKDDGGYDAIVVRKDVADSILGDQYIYFGDGEIIETEEIANEIADFIITRLSNPGVKLHVLTQKELDAYANKAIAKLQVDTEATKGSWTPTLPPHVKNDGIEIYGPDLNEGWR